MITGYGTVESAVTAIKLGAYDYLTKPFDMDKLLKVVENVSEKFSLGEEIRSLKERLQAYAEASEIVSISERMRRILELIQKVAPIDCNVLIQGESGTGKGLVAQQIHRRSPRQAHPLVVVDCAALSETLLESELFGYVKGAFTGAYADKDGYFKVAHRGTIFLDEVGELSPALQGKLLRMVQDHEIIPVGSTRPITIDARIIAATNKDLEALVREGRFREDLFFRLNVVRIDVPPLRDRPEDISLLAHFFLEKFKTRFRKLNCTLDPKVAVLDSVVRVAGECAGTGEFNAAPGRGIRRRRHSTPVPAGKNKARRPRERRSGSGLSRPGLFQRPKDVPGPFHPELPGKRPP